MPEIDDDVIRDNEAQNATRALREDIAGAMEDQGVRVPAEAVDTSLPPAKPEAAAPPEAPATDPAAPVSFSGPAKAAVAKLQAGAPLSAEEGKTLAAALARRETEINNGFSKLKDFKGLEEYAAHYGQQGMSVKQVLDTYHEAEKLLGTDFERGLDMLIQRYGVNPQVLATRLAQRVGLASNGPQTAPQTAGMTQAEKQALAQLVQHAQTLEREVGTLKQQVSISRASDIASKARIAGSSITGGPSSTPAQNIPELGLRETLERAFRGGDRA